MIPGDMVAETFFVFVFFGFVSLVFAVFWNRHVWFVWSFGLGSFVSDAEKQLKTKTLNKPNMQFSKHAKTHTKKTKQQKHQSLSNHVPRNHVTKSWLLRFGFFMFGVCS